MPSDGMGCIFLLIPTTIYFTATQPPSTPIPPQVLLMQTTA